MSKRDDLFEVICVELSNKDAINNASNDVAEFDILLNEPLRLKKGGTAMISDAFLSFYNGAPVTSGNIIIENDYDFTMQFALLWINCLDNLPTTGQAPIASQVPLGFQSILTDINGQPILVNLNISIKAGSYTPGALVQEFNRQTSSPQYLGNAVNGLIKNPPISGAVAGNALDFALIRPFTQVPDLMVLYTQGVSQNPDLDFGYQIISVPYSGAYAIPTYQVVIYGSNGFLLDFDENLQKFSISSNFMALINNDNQAFSVLRMNDPNTAGGRIFIDRTSECLVQNWGYKISEWKSSFWYRLGFEVTDLMKTNRSDPNMFGRTFANIDILDVDQTTNAAMCHPTLAGLNLNQSVINMSTEGSNVYSVSTYDGSTLPIYASNVANLIPLPYVRARLDLQVVGGYRNDSARYSFTQPVSLLDISSSGITSFSILNPILYMFPSDMHIKVIRVYLQDPRDDKPLRWISKNMISSLFLRIQQQQA